MAINDPGTGDYGDLIPPNLNMGNNFGLPANTGPGLGFAQQPGTIRAISDGSTKATGRCRTRRLAVALG
jgi:hypothetical protein